MDLAELTREIEALHAAPCSPQGQVGTLLSEADFERIVFSSPSQVLDVSRRTGFFAGAPPHPPTARRAGSHV